MCVMNTWIDRSGCELGCIICIDILTFKITGSFVYFASKYIDALGIIYNIIS